MVFIPIRLPQPVRRSEFSPSRHSRRRRHVHHDSYSENDEYCPKYEAEMEEIRLRLLAKDNIRMYAERMWDKIQSQP